LDRQANRNAFTALGAYERIDGREAWERIHRAAVQATCATDRVGGYRAHGGVDPVGRDGSDDRATFVAYEIRFGATKLGDDEAATISARVFVRDHRLDSISWPMRSDLVVRAGRVIG